MSKNITIQEGGAARTLSGVEKIVTNVAGESGTQNWVPEDEAASYVDTGELSVSENGTYYSRDDGYIGFSKVVVDVESGGGGGDEPTLITKEITENGTYSASDDDADGYSSVTVNVSGGGGGGGGGTIGDYYYPVKQTSSLPTDEVYTAVEWNGKVYAFLSGTQLYSFNGSTWTLEGALPSGRTCEGGQLVVYNNQLYLIGASKTSGKYYNLIYRFGGGQFTYITEGPGGGGSLSGTNNKFVYNGLVYISTDYIFTFNGTNVVNTNVQGLGTGMLCAMYNNTIYGVVFDINTNKNVIYTFNGGQWSLSNLPEIPIYSALKGFTFQGDKLHALGETEHYSYNGKWWRNEEILPYHPKVVCGTNKGIYLISSTLTNYRRRNDIAEYVKS